MANDRLMLRCEACRETFTLLKFWGGGDFATPAPMSVEGQRQGRELLNAWTERHAKECLGLFGTNLEALDGRLRIVTEQDAA